MKTLYLKVTDKCQLNCKHCYNRDQSTYGEMYLDRFVDFVVKIVLSYVPKTTQVVFHGGEPMLYDHEVLGQSALLSAIEFLKIHGFSVAMTTNLTYKLTPQRLEILKSLDQLSVSWDYKIRFNEKEEVLFLKNLNKIKDLEPMVIVSLTKLLIDEVTPHAFLWKMKSFGIKTFNIERLTDNPDVRANNLMPTNKEVREWLYGLYKENRDTFGFNIPLFEELHNAVHGELFGCRARKCTDNVMTINPDGTIGTCPNISKDIIQDSWGDWQIVNWSKLKKQEQTLEPDCLGCKWLDICHGDCFQLKHDTTGCVGLIEIMEDMFNESKTF